MNNEVSNFLKKIAEEVKNNFTIYDNLHGEIILEDSEDKQGGNSKVHLSTGSVYGIFAIKTKESDIDKLFEETKNSVKSINEKETIYPVYWGKRY